MTPVLAATASEQAELIVFIVLAPLAVVTALGMVLSRNAVYSALLLVVNFFCLAVFYLFLQAQFLAAVQVIVYAGAIMVLFLFVIMLLGVDRGDDLRERLVAQRPLALLLAAGFVIEIVVAVRAGIGFATKAPEGFDAVNEPGNAQALARVLFREYFFPFEVTSILLIVAAIAAIVLAQRKARAVTQAELEAMEASTS
ncbi:MAG TPA: NADH-quinone oxidoreductase subunit J [Actinomycetes bacterium]|nr:NADH-quinone oxidoreductase subunit J [Actinomycetes bacterium]